MRKDFLAADVLTLDAEAEIERIAQSLRAQVHAHLAGGVRHHAHDP